MHDASRDDEGHTQPISLTQMSHAQWRSTLLCDSVQMLWDRLAPTSCLNGGMPRNYTALHDAQDLPDMEKVNLRYV